MRETKELHSGCGQCLMNDGLNCDVFEDPRKAWELPNGCPAFRDDLNVIKTHERERRDYSEQRGCSTPGANNGIKAMRKL